MSLPASLPPSDAGLDHFFDTIGARGAHRTSMRRCLERFPPTIRSRGLFFEGVLNVLRQRRSDVYAREVAAVAGLPPRIANFSLYPHRDFYKLFYAAAYGLHPNLDLPKAMEKVAEDFYPLMFAESLAGRTIQILLTKDPITVFGRFVEAYKISVEGNEHAFEASARGPHTWRCTVEPNDYYPQTFQGIARGMIQTVTGLEPRITVRSFDRTGDFHRYVFDVVV